jgi:nucleoside 2-deoxyribosyltransferase
MSFAKEMVDAKKKLEEMGFEGLFAPDTHDCFNNPHLKLNEDLEHCERTDIMRACMNVQEKCDAILVLNYPKNGIDGYIGANTLMELGLAYYLKQKIFLLYPPPSKEDARYNTEVVLMKPIILNGDLEKLRGLKKITICGSIKFADKIVEIYKKLDSLGHKPQIHEHMFGLVDGTAPQLSDKIETCEIKKKYDYIKSWHNLIVDGDAVLICNFDKNGIKNYIGGNTLMEMGFAHVHGKKIFLFNPINDVLPYADEIKAMYNLVIDGDLSKISGVLS